MVSFFYSCVLSARLSCQKGRFLKGVLQDLYTWHRDETAYEAANRRKMGSDTILLPGLQATWSRIGPTSPDQLLKWSDFKLFMKKCHRRLCQVISPDPDLATFSEP